jgi:hypothetical protein
MPKTQPALSNTTGRGRPHQSVLAKALQEPERITPCRYDPERWHPDEQKPDPTAVAACWSCHFQPQCASRALANNESFGIWGGYRLAPGPGLVRSRQQLAIIAGAEMGPPASPGAETAAVLAATHSNIETSPNIETSQHSAQVISLTNRQAPNRASAPAAPKVDQIRAHAG